MDESKNAIDQGMVTHNFQHDGIDQPMPSIHSRKYTLCLSIETVRLS